MTNYLPKLKSLFSTTVTTSVDASGTSGTITLASVTGLPTDAEITLTFDRIATDGVTLTPTKMERIRGTISGSNLINYTRAVEGTEQVHSSGTIVEVIFNGSDWNSLVDGLLVEHNQTGTHKAALVTTLKATGAVVTTGTSDVTIVTPKALADAGFVLDTTTTLGTSDVKVPSQKAVKTYVDVLPTAASTTTFTNKRVTPRVVSTTSYTTDTGTSLNCDTTDRFIVTAQAGALKLNNPSGTPTDGQTMWVSVTGTAARALTYDTQFEASAAVALPTTTVTTNRLDMGFVWIAATSKWRIVASA